MSTQDVEHKPESIPFYPDHVRTEAYVALGVLAVFVVIAVLGHFFPVGLGAPADPMDTPAHIKPEWYFLSLYQLLKYVPKTVGVMIPIVGLLVVMIWPFLDGKPDTSPRARRVRLIGVVLFAMIVIALTIWGELS